MKHAIESFVVLVIVVIMALLSVSFISANIDTTNARNFHSAVINQLEAGDYSDDVVAACMEEAENEGYTLEIYPSAINGDKRAEVIVTYDYTIGILNIYGEKHEIRGYAR